MGADGLKGLREAGEALTFFVLSESGPEAVVDVIEEVLDEPAFLGAEGSGRVGFGRGGERCRGHEVEVGKFLGR